MFWLSAGSGLLTRKMRTALSALGITIGIAAMVGVLGISESSRADLRAQIAALGTNLLTVTPSGGFGGGDGVLPAEAVGKVSEDRPGGEGGRRGRTRSAGAEERFGKRKRDWRYHCHGGRYRLADRAQRRGVGRDLVDRGDGPPLPPSCSARWRRNAWESNRSIRAR